MQSFGRIPAFGQLVDHFVHADLGAAEDDPVKFGFDVDDSRQRVEFVAVAHFEVDLVGQFGGDFLCRYAQDFHVAHVFFRQADDPFGHGRRKQQDAAVVVRIGQDFFDVFDKAHIEHFVRFVEDQVFQGLDVQCSATQVVEDAAGRADYDIDAFAQTPQLFGHRSSSVDRRNDEFAFGVERQDFFGNLQGQFAGGNQNQRLGRSFLRAQSFEDWQAESGGFTGAGLGLCDDIVCFFVVEQNGDREFLDRRRGFEAFRFNGFEGDIGQSERSEFF